MRVRRRILALVAVVVMTALAGPVAALRPSSAGAASAGAGPQVRTSTPVASVGDRVLVTGTGWSPVGQTVLIQICGQDDRNFSTDCNQVNQYTAAIRAGGIFYGALTVQLPPVPCPCVFSVTTPSSLADVKVPVTIVGAPDDIIPTPVPPAAPVALTAHIEQTSSLSSSFGGPWTVTLILSVSNRSSVAFGTPTLVVTVGHVPDPTGFVVGLPMAPLDAGATRVMRVPVTIPPFTFGHYAVRAQVTTGLGPVSTTAFTSSYPWGLLVLAVVLLVLLLLVLILVLRKRKRDRRRKRVFEVAALSASGVRPVAERRAEPVAVWTPDQPIARFVPVPPTPAGPVVTWEPQHPGSTPVGPVPVPGVAPSGPWEAAQPMPPPDHPAGVQ